MSSGRKRGRPKRKAQRRAKWQHEQRFSKRFDRQDPKRLNAKVVTIHSTLLRPRPLREDDYIFLANEDGAPDSPYAARKEA